MAIKKPDLWHFIRLHGRLEELRQAVGKPKGADDAYDDDVRCAVVNALFKEADGFLGNESPLGSTVPLPLDPPPNDADLALLIGQLLACLESYKAQHVKYRHGRYYWQVHKDENPNEVEYVPVNRSDNADSKS